MSTLLTLSGTAGIREKIALPDGSVLTVKLVTNDGEVLAATAVLANAGETPFELVVDAVLAPQPETLRLWAMLRTDVGVWGTPELVSIREDLILRRVDD
ncbi:hypothetical protein ASD11_15890 [Aeromicrobium sp. Root495]|uniref:YbaY family lipoprotein n=1 Tax=Aeromicrobium sp. Root495 TaxID=1736550 RepID=UPI0006F91E7D|nr:YbaY family lipoprotein [Aeromicrobium sp. Root495]KQY55962.1 hypothetical protein ASD11_15890 [Aeromicrobium sp. Root495]